MGLKQYATYDDLPEPATDGAWAEVTTTSAAGVYQYVAEVNGDPVGFWIPADIALRIVDYVRQGRRVVSATLNAAGSGYSASDVLYFTGGYGPWQGSITVDTVGGSGEILTYTLNDLGGGSYTIDPYPLTANPVDYTGAGTGATFNLTMGAGDKPCRISIGKGGDTLPDLESRNWTGYTSGSGVTPAIVSGALQLSSGGTSGNSNYSGFNFTRAEDFSKNDTYFMILQCDTTGVECFIDMFNGGAFGESDRHNYARFGGNYAAWRGLLNGTDTILGRQDASWTFSAFDTVFGLYNWHRNPAGVSAELMEIWRANVGRGYEVVTTELNKLEATTGFKERAARLHARNALGTNRVFRIKEYHLFKLTPEEEVIPTTDPVAEVQRTASFDHIYDFGVYAYANTQTPRPYGPLIDQGSGGANLTVVGTWTHNGQAIQGTAGSVATSAVTIRLESGAGAVNVARTADVFYEGIWQFHSSSPTANTALASVGTYNTAQSHSFLVWATSGYVRLWEPNFTNRINATGLTYTFLQEPTYIAVWWDHSSSVYRLYYKKAGQSEVALASATVTAGSAGNQQLWVSGNNTDINTTHPMTVHAFGIKRAALTAQHRQNIYDAMGI